MKKLTGQIHLPINFDPAALPACLCRNMTIALIAMIMSLNVRAQQNNTLFFMHSIPESNFVNPAIQGGCGLFLGLPVISSFHANIANSGFVAGDYVTLYTDGEMRRNSYLNTDRIPRNNYFVSELHSVIFAVGLKRNDLYYSFTIMEKNNAIVPYTRDLVTFSLRGSSDFEGKSIELTGARVVFNHYREFAFGISKKYKGNLTLGAKIKLLFGKFNFNTGNSTWGLYVEPGTRDILLNIDGGFNSSLPYALAETSPGIYRFDDIYEASMFKHLINPRNPGLAIDLGFIYKYSDKLTFSGSLLDIGLISYLSNLGNYSVSGSQYYQGPFGQGSLGEQDFWNVFDAMNANMTEETGSDPYVHFLDPKLYLGAAYKLNKRYDLNFLLYNRLLPGKLQTGTTVSLLTSPLRNLQTSISWSYMNNSITNLGIGIGYEKRPVQIYLVSDNIMGFILPMSTKNINLRFGINLKLGCREIFDIDQCGCEWLRAAEKRELRHQKFRQGRKT